MRKFVPAVLAAGLLAGFAAGTADAGQIVSASGPVTVNGKQATAAQPIVLKAGDKVATGAGVTAVFRSDAGDEIRLDPNTTIRHEGVDGGSEYVLVERGTAQGAVSAKTTFGSSSAWATAPQGQRSEVRVEAPAEKGGTEGRFRSLRGDTWLRNGSQAVWLPANNSVTLNTDPAKPGDMCFRTAQTNEGTVTVRRTVAGGNIDARIPRASSGCVMDHPNNRTKISNDLTSSKTTKIIVATDYGARGGASIGPGTFALIDNSTGTVETFLEDLFEDLGDDATDYDPVEDSSDASLTRRGKR